MNRIQDPGKENDHKIYTKITKLVRENAFNLSQKSIKQENKSLSRNSSKEVRRITSNILSNPSGFFGKKSEQPKSLSEC
jgi:hypothetical protein